MNYYKKYLKYKSKYLDLKGGDLVSGKVVSGRIVSGTEIKKPTMCKTKLYTSTNREIKPFNLQIYSDEKLTKALALEVITGYQDVEILEIKGNVAKVIKYTYIKDIGTSPALKLVDTSSREYIEGWVDLTKLRNKENKDCKIDTYFEFQDNYPIECTYVGTTSIKLKKSSNEHDKTLNEQKMIIPNEQLKVIERSDDKKYLKVKYGDGVNDNGWIDSIHLKIIDDNKNFHTCRIVPPKKTEPVLQISERRNQSRVIGSSSGSNYEPKHEPSEPK